MNCKECNNNYLRKIFMSCLKEFDNVGDAWTKFDIMCEQSGDPRNPLTIALSMSTNTCDSCKEYREYYKNILDNIESKKYHNKGEE